ncbi:MAG: hypothetical protein WCE79_00145 [Xanthobacteraceae bacterium]
MDAQTKALKFHRKRLRTRGMKRVEVTVPVRDAELVRRIASVLRADNPPMRLVADNIREVVSGKKQLSAAEVIDAGPDISGPEFDTVFDEIERLRRDPVLQRTREVDL